VVSALLTSERQRDAAIVLWRLVRVSVLTLDAFGLIGFACFAARPVVDAARVRENWFSLALIMGELCQTERRVSSSKFCRFWLNAGAFACPTAWRAGARGGVKSGPPVFERVSPKQRHAVGAELVVVGEEPKQGVGVEQQSHSE
jgi:hypothetical protein